MITVEKCHGFIFILQIYKNFRLYTETLQVVSKHSTSNFVFFISLSNVCVALWPILPIINISPLGIWYIIKSTSLVSMPFEWQNLQAYFPLCQYTFVCFVPIMLKTSSLLIYHVRGIFLLSHIFASAFIFNWMEIIQQSQRYRRVSSHRFLKDFLSSDEMFQCLNVFILWKATFYNSVHLLNQRQISPRLLRHYPNK